MRDEPRIGDDHDVVARCVAGDRAAWRTLYDRHAPQVYRFLAAFGLRDDEREDASQEVFVAVYRSLPQFRSEAKLSTWIYRIAVREGTRLVQRRRLRSLLAGVLAHEPPPSPAPDPSERAAAMRALDSLLRSLSPRKRVVLVLFDIEGLPVSEIARVVGCPENTVWSRLHHARAELTKMARRRLR